MIAMVLLRGEFAALLRAERTQRRTTLTFLRRESPQG